MSPAAETVPHPDKDTLAARSAERALAVLVEAQEERGEATVVLTGGSMGAAVLAALGASPRRADVDWSRVNVWWSDERWVAEDSPERNCVQAVEALGGALALDPDRVHYMGSADEFATAEDAALDYRRELAAAADAEQRTEAFPVFDLSLLGLGPDGHVASLFPGLPHVHGTEATVVAVHGSPKPPPDRISMSLPLVNAARRVWFLVAGADKAEAVAAVRAGAPLERTPGAGVRRARSSSAGAREDQAATSVKRMVSAYAAMDSAHTTAVPVVSRMRFFWATPEVLSDWVIPPPNMSESPPPLPLFRSTSRTARRLVITMIARSTVCRISTGAFPRGVRRAAAPGGARTVRGS
jgi:6-phosphogluconolactonase